MLTEDNCGIVARHIQVIQEIAKERATFIFVRPVNRDATSLIASGFGTKRLDIHAKSANWGPMSGLICVDSALSKVTDEGDGAVQKNRAAVAHALHTRGVGQVQLMLPPTRIEELVGKGLFSETRPGQIFEARSPKKKTTMRFVFEQDGSGPNLRVYYFPAGAAGKQPLMVLGYANGQQIVAVTADYDLFAICPHFSTPGFALNWVVGVQQRGMQGTLSAFQQMLIGEINQRCGGPPVVNHGTELNNPFPESDRELAMFVPGTDSRMVERYWLPAIFGDLAMRGFHVYFNAAWSPAVTTRYGAKINQLRNPARRGGYALAALREPDFNALSVEGYGDETRTAFAQQRFGTEVANGLAASVRPRWRS